MAGWPIHRLMWMTQAQLNLPPHSNHGSMAMSEVEAAAWRWGSVLLFDREVTDRQRAEAEPLYSQITIDKLQAKIGVLDRANVTYSQKVAELIGRAGNAEAALDELRSRVEAAPLIEARPENRLPVRDGARFHLLAYASPTVAQTPTGTERSRPHGQFAAEGDGVDVRARRLLATELERDGYADAARQMRAGTTRYDGGDLRALRAIEAALREGAAGAPEDAR